MVSLITKLVFVPIVLFIAMYSSNQVNYGEVWQPIITAITLIVAGLIMEHILLKKRRLWISVFIDFIASLAIIWGLSNLFNQAEVTLMGAFGMSLVLAVIELLLHKYLLATNLPEEQSSQA